MNTIQQQFTRAQRIAKIIEQRQPLVKKIQRVETHLQNINSAIKELENHRQRLEITVREIEVKEKLQQANFSHLIQKIDAELVRLDILRQRFSCSTLNIGVVGLMGQGKSTLLKTISGLTDNEIPALEGGACTAVRSTIANHQESNLPEVSNSKQNTQPNGFISQFYTFQEQTFASQENTSIQAEVTLHSEDSFLKEVIWPYYSELGFTDKPYSLDNFAREKLPERYSGGASEEEMYKHLRNDYHRNLGNYRHLVKSGTPQKLKIKVEEIPEYVVQKRDGTQENNLTTFKHLAVREVKIFCPFKNPDVGKISLIDIPGLGDSKLGDEQLMLEALGREVDVVLFIKRPDPQRYQWQPQDTELYDKAAQALNDLDKRSFMILNYSRRTDNIKACQVLQQNINTIKVVQSEIADCSNSQDANRVLNLVLDYLAVNIHELDKRYASFYQKSLITLHQQINLELNAACSSLSQYSSDSRQFISLFNQLLRELIKGLLELRNYLEQQKDQIDPDFEAAVKIALQNCENDKGIPSSDEEIISRSCEFEFKESYQAIYRVYIRELKIHLSRHFLNVDKGLRKSIDKVKSLVTDVLVNQGRLAELKSTRGAEFLQEIADLLAERENKLELGFRTLWEFEFSYGGSLLCLIRQQLDQLLESDINQAVLDINNPLPEPANAQEVRTNLEKLHQQAIEGCEKTLQEWLKAPSKARYYMIQEFIDLVIYAKDMKKEWEIFLSDDDIRSKVWPEFKNLEKRKQDQQNWRNLVTKVATLNQLSALRFMN